MIYQKNLPIWERLLRAAAGLLMIAGGLLAPGLAGSVAGYVVAGSGLMAAATGFVGFCPACAMVGRRLKS
jgi:hypothetical protein